MLAVITILTLIGTVGLCFGSIELYEKNGKVGTILYALGYLLLCISFALAIPSIEENTVINFINNEITYDTVSLDKNGKLLEINIKTIKRE